MTKQSIVYIAGLMILGCCLVFSQPRTGKEILEMCARNYAGIEDYTVTVAAEVNMDRLRMPRMTATLYFKAPDKIFFESPGFAMLPREGFGLPVTALLLRYVSSLDGDDNIGGIATYKLHLVAKDPAARSQQLFLWVNKANFTILRTATVPYQGRSVTMNFVYGLKEGNYWLPDTMKVELAVPPRDSVAEAAETQNPAGQALDELRRPMRSGSITVTYLNYRINTGLSDDRFRPRLKEQQ